MRSEHVAIEVGHGRCSVRTQIVAAVVHDGPEVVRFYWNPSWIRRILAELEQISCENIFVVMNTNKSNKEKRIQNDYKVKT